MKCIFGLVVGGLLAFAIACGGSSPKMSSTGGGNAARAELERLDQAITTDMQKLAEPRPAPPVDACVENCAQAMSGAATATTADDPSCKPGKGETCSEQGTLKDSICKNAGRICAIAADLGGNDAYANETCNRGKASCDAAKKRYCSCI